MLWVMQHEPSQQEATPGVEPERNTVWARRLESLWGNVCKWSHKLLHLPVCVMVCVHAPVLMCWCVDAGCVNIAVMRLDQVWCSPQRGASVFRPPLTSSLSLWCRKWELMGGASLQVDENSLIGLYHSVLNIINQSINQGTDGWLETGCSSKGREQKAGCGEEVAGGRTQETRK